MEAFADDVGRGTSAWGVPASLPELADDTSELKGGELVHAAIEALWNGRLAAAVSRFYSQRYRARINARHIFGSEEMQRQVLEMLAALPDLRVYIDDVICRDEREGQFTSARWTVLGTNTGPTRYAGPSNRYVRLTGITNHHIVDSRFQAGWTQYNELSLLQQLTTKREAMPESECDG
jgi:predicted ester cyclase